MNFLQILKTIGSATQLIDERLLKVSPQTLEGAIGRAAGYIYAKEGIDITEKKSSLFEKEFKNEYLNQNFKYILIPIVLLIVIYLIIKKRK